MELEGQLESVSEHHPEPGSEELFFEQYHVPLDNSADIDQRPRTTLQTSGGRNKRDSDRSFDFSTIAEDDSENPISSEFFYAESNERFSHEGEANGALRAPQRRVSDHLPFKPGHDEALKAPQRRISDQLTHKPGYDEALKAPQRRISDQLSHKPGYDEALVAPQRRISAQSVSFQESSGNSSDHNAKGMKEEYTRKAALSQISPSRVRMDGYVVSDDDSQSPVQLFQTSGNTNLTSPNRNPTPSTRSSLSWNDLDSGNDNDTNNDGYYGRNWQDSFADSSNGANGNASFNTNGSSPVDTRSPSQNFSLASSDNSSRRRTWSYGGSDAQGRNQEARSPDENRISGASFDDSDTSDIGDPGLRDRIRDIFNFHSISIFIVRLMPYFCCLCCLQSRNELRGNSFTDWFILSRLNILSFFFSAIQFAASSWLIVIMFIEGFINTFGDEYEDQFNLWNNNAIIVLTGVFAFVLLLSCLWTIRIVKEMDLANALRLLWLLLWILPIVAFLNITAFDFYEVTSIWIKHNWDSTQLWWFRNQLCSPEADGTETHETLCLVPIDGGTDYESENEWCFELYNSTDCTEIRDEAQEETRFILLTFYRSLASWGFVYMFVMLLIIKALERIISKPMVQKSREVNVVGWLIFPVLCTALFGSIILFSPYTYLDKFVQPRWIGYLYLITSGLFFIALLMGWFLSAFSIRSNLDKQNKSNAALILVVVLCINALVLLAIITASFHWSHNLNITDSQRGGIACTMNGSQCTNCDPDVFSPEDMCPEWSFEEISRIVRRQLNQSAFMAAIFILYDLNVMVHGLNLRKNLSMYQIDYV